MADREQSGGRRGGAGSIRHHPVLLPEVVERLSPRDGARYIDGTFGAGGYTCAILAAAQCHVWALDRDPAAILAGGELAKQFTPRLTLSQMTFGDLGKRIDDDPGLVGAFDGVVLDLGVSSMQIDDAERGFSFLRDGPLDMRMSSGGSQADAEVMGPSAADVVNTCDQALIADILFQLGEERRSRQIAAAIVRKREERPFQSTIELADVVAGVLGRKPGDRIHPATRTFQALRIYVNDELGELVRVLAAAERLLQAGGRLVVVTFHSLEDRLVKRFLASRGGRRAGVSRHLPQIESGPAPSFQILNHRAVSPSEEEIQRNPRARSAKLRAGVRTAAAAQPLDGRSLGLPEVLCH